MKNSIITDSFLSSLEAISLNMKTNMRGYFGGSHKTNTYGSTVEFADFREYNLGDDIRRIDWNLFSRFEKYFIRLFTDERQMHIQLILDCSSSMNFKDSKKREFAIKAVAAMGFLAVQNMDKVTIKLMRDGVLEDLCGVISGKNAFLKAVSLLEDVQFGGSAQFDKAITRDMNPGYSDGLTVIVSDFLTESDWKQAVNFLLYRHREVMLFHTLDDEEMDPTYKGRNILLDTESSDRYDLRNLQLAISRSELDAYKRALRDYLADIKNFCTKRNVTYIFARTSEKFEKVVMEQLYQSEVVS